MLCCSLSLECHSLASFLSILCKALFKGHRLWLKGHFLRRQTPLLPTPSCYSTWPPIFCPCPTPVASHLKTSFCVVVENMGSEVDYPGSSPGYHLLFQPLSEPSFPQRKNGANSSAYIQELLRESNSTSGTEPSYRIARRLHLSSVTTEEKLSKFQYYHRHHYQTLGRDGETRLR